MGSEPMLTPREKSPLLRLRGGWNPRRCIKQNSEPSTLPTELFRPQIVWSRRWEGGRWWSSFRLDRSIWVTHEWSCLSIFLSLAPILVLAYCCVFSMAVNVMIIFFFAEEGLITKSSCPFEYIRRRIAAVSGNVEPWWLASVMIFGVRYGRGGQYCPPFLS